MSHWRFRATWRGKLILQRLAEQDGPSQTWRDATTSDLADYYNQLEHKA